MNACQNNADQAHKQGATGQYFNVAAFIQDQVNVLNQQKPVATKTVAENNTSKESKTLRNLNWQKELESFSELDINKPALRNSYTIQKKQNVAGYTTETYTKKPETDGDIQFLSVTRDLQGQVNKIKALRTSYNTLIFSRKELELECYTRNGQAIVNKYQIKGVQKSVFFDSLRYVIFTEIR
ncbi:hypothetical protein [Adhaeribacter aquaticus]|uniref:hypothetical protein n=1 Tax=Adhaeribacter aquaticus TaxID=299567 RepID=UPI0003FAA733|nr:hypothetical protein [Adhaeribacter aquaticus]